MRAPSKGLGLGSGVHVAEQQSPHRVQLACVTASATRQQVTCALQAPGAGRPRHHPARAPAAPCAPPRLRQARIERLRHMRAAAVAAGTADDGLGGGAPGAGGAPVSAEDRSGGDDDDTSALGPGPAPQDMRSAIAAVLPSARRRRVVDALAEVLGAAGSGDEEGSGSGDDDSDDPGLDWRRKAV